MPTWSNTRPRLLPERWPMSLSACRASADLLGQPDENALGASDVAEPIHVFVLDHFVDELRAVSAEPGERIVEVVHREHDTQIAQSVHRGVPVIGDHRRREKSRELEPAVAVRRTHHRDLDALVAHPVTRPDQSPSIMARPSSSRPSSRKNAIAAGRSSTTMPTLSIR